MEAIKVIKEQNIPCRNTEILFTIGEEGGMNGVKNMDLSMIKGKKRWYLTPAVISERS